MSEYVVSARKYRPGTFDEVVGQEQVTQTLLNEINSNQLAQAFLFCGPRGVGKTTCARILAKEINGADVGDLSFNIFELDAASNNSVEDIRALIDQVRVPPQVGNYKVYIIDEVHMLSQQAFNAFLKTLEEPPPYAIFILATTEKHKILPTILSRCQIFDFKRIQVVEMVKHLKGIAEKEGIVVEEKALHVVAEKADGALRDALSLFDKMVSFSGNNVTYEMVIDNLNILDYDYFFKITDQLLIENNVDALLLYDEIFKKGFEGDTFILGLAEHLRNLLMCKHPKTHELIETAGEVKQQYIEQASKSSEAFLLNALNILNKCDIGYRTAKNKRLHIEIALLKICFLNSTIQQSLTGEGAKKKRPEIKPKQIKPAVVAQENAIHKEKISTSAPHEEKIKKQVAPEKPIIKDVVADEDEDFDLLSLDSLGKKKIVEVVPQKEIIVTQELIDSIWASFVEDNVEEMNKQFIVAVKAQQPIFVGGDLVKVEVSNTIVYNQILEERMMISEYFMNKLQGKRIEFEFLKVIDESQENAEKPLSQKELFIKMANENPAILQLQKKFDLDLEY